MLLHNIVKERESLKKIWIIYFNLMINVTF